MMSRIRQIRCRSTSTIKLVMHGLQLAFFFFISSYVDAIWVDEIVVSVVAEVMSHLKEVGLTAKLQAQTGKS